LSIPDNARGVIVLAQGSRNIESNVPIAIFADVLQGAGLATLAVHLLTDDEEELDRSTQFFRLNVSILHQRIIGIANWLLENPATRNLSIGYFGTGVTGAAVLIAAAERPDPVYAVVAVGARTDLAQEYLSRVLAPTFLIVGENDSATTNMNREALKQIPAEVEANKRIETISGATGLFETPELVNKVAELASQWFQRHLEPIV
jgi:dienelactone hydrolase